MGFIDFYNKELPPLLDPVLFCGHNLSEESFRFNDRYFGGLIAPSFFITKNTLASDNFGDITLIPKKTLMSKVIRSTMSCDTYTPRSPAFKFTISEEKLQIIVDEINTKAKYLEEFLGFSPARLDSYSVGRSLEDGLKQFFYHGASNESLMYVFYNESFNALPEKQYKDNIDKYSLERTIVNALGNDFFSSLWESDKEYYLHAVDSFQAWINHDSNKELISLFGDSLIVDHNGLAVIDSQKFFGQFGEKINAYIKQPLVLDTDAMYAQVRDFAFKNSSSFHLWANKTFGETLLNDMSYIVYDEEYGEHEYYKATPDAVLKDYISRIEVGEDFKYGGVGYIRSKYASPLNTKAKLLKFADFLVDSEIMEETKNSLDGDFDSLLDDLIPYYLFDNDDSTVISEELQDCMVAYKTNKRAFEEVFSSEILDSDFYNRVNTFIERLKHTNTEYFESKIYECIKWSSFGVAIAPNTVSTDTLDLMTKKKLLVLTYDPKIEGDRLRVVNAALQTTQLEISQLPEKEVVDYKNKGVNRNSVKMMV